MEKARLAIVVSALLVALQLTACSGVDLATVKLEEIVPPSAQKVAFYATFDTPLCKYMMKASKGALALCDTGELKKEALNQFDVAIWERVENKTSTKIGNTLGWFGGLAVGAAGTAYGVPLMTGVGNGVAVAIGDPTPTTVIEGMRLYYEVHTKNSAAQYDCPDDKPFDSCRKMILSKLPGYKEGDSAFVREKLEEYRKAAAARGDE